MTASSEALPVAVAGAEHPGGMRPPRLSGGWPLLGHLLELRRDPIALMQRLRAACG